MSIPSVSPLAGRVAVVTGVSRRIGIAATIARQMLLDGASVLATGWHPHDADQPWGAESGRAQATIDFVTANLPEAHSRFHYTEADLADPDVPDSLGTLAVERFDELPYIISKGAIQQMTASLSDGLIDEGITVNCVNPGPVDTGYADPESHAHVAAMFPSKRWGQPADVASLVRFLVSDDGAWITGQTLNSEGGFRR